MNKDENPEKIRKACSLPEKKEEDDFLHIPLPFWYDPDVEKAVPYYWPVYGNGRAFIGNVAADCSSGEDTGSSDED